LFLKAPALNYCHVTFRLTSPLQFTAKTVCSEQRPADDVRSIIAGEQQLRSFIAAQLSG